jgi:hypothetical protein
LVRKARPKAAAIQPHEARAGRVGELVALMNAVDDERIVAYRLDPATFRG